MVVLSFDHPQQRKVETRNKLLRDSGKPRARSGKPTHCMQKAETRAKLCTRTENRLTCSGNLTSTHKRPRFDPLFANYLQESIPSRETCFNTAGIRTSGNPHEWEIHTSGKPDGRMGESRGKQDEWRTRRRRNEGGKRL
jgi:hypothetical protein